MAIKPIKRMKVSDEVFEQMQNLLAEGEWKTGERLPSENELAEMFGVSRITVRQALQRLALLGLIETRLGEGSFVKEIEPGNNMNALIPAILFNREEMEQVLEFREIIEVESAKLAAQRATDEDIETLKKLWQKMKESEGKPVKFSQADLAFHMKVGEMTRNDFVIKTQGILRSTLQEAMNENIERMGYEPGIRYHGEMIKAFEARDSKYALQLMKEHLAHNRSFYVDKEQN